MAWSGRSCRVVVVGVLMALGAAVAGCGSGDDPDPGADTVVPGTVSRDVPTSPGPPPAPPDPPAPPVRGPYEPGGLRRIVSQLVQQLGEQPRVLEVTLSDVFATFEVQDPDRPGEVNEYEWRDGVIEGPTPAHGSTSGQPLEDVLFRFDQLNLNAAASLAQLARQQPFEGATVSTMIVRSGLPFRSGVVWYVNVSGTRESRQLRATANGRVYQVV